MKRQTYYLSGIYALVIAIGLTGYFYDFRAFLIVAVGLCGLVGITVLQKLYESVLRDRLNSRSRSSFSTLFLTIAAISLMGTIYFYLSSLDIGTSGFLLGTALYCLQSYILEPN